MLNTHFNRGIGGGAGIGQGIELAVSEHVLAHIVPASILWESRGPYLVPVFSPVPDPARLAEYRACGTLIMVHMMRHGAAFKISPFLIAYFLMGPRGLVLPSHIIHAFDSEAGEILNPWLDLGYDQPIPRDPAHPVREFLIEHMSLALPQVCATIRRRHVPEVADFAFRWYDTAVVHP